MQNDEMQNVVFAGINEMMPLIMETVKSGKSVELSPRGVSMLPMLREGRDSVLLSAPQGKLKKYDIPLYQRADGTYVLHRIVRVGEYFTCIGDSQYLAEKVYPDQIIAVVTSFKREGRIISTDSFFYRVYAVFWTCTRPVRYFFVRAKRKLKRIFKKKK